MPRSWKRRWLAFGFRVGRTLAGDRPPRYGPGRGFPRHAPFGSGAPELQSSAPNLANRVHPANPAPLWLQVLEHASDRGGQAPALRARERFFLPCAVRDQAIPNYSLLLIVVNRENLVNPAHFWLILLRMGDAQKKI